MDEPELILQINTPAGVVMRRIQAASLLPTGVPPGPAAEAATRNFAAYWGLPDFVFRPALLRRSSGTRELGDAIVVVGDLAACVQVKARTAFSGRDDRERAWLDKHIAEAIRQAAGTIRSLHEAGSTAMINERGRTVEISGDRKSWTRVVILDHPGLAGYLPQPGAVVLRRRDWEFLFAQLKSTYAVLEYLERVSGAAAPVPLGDEPVRYHELAMADLQAPQHEGHPRLTAIGHRTSSVPQLPLEPVANGEIIRIILEDLATAPLPDGTDPAVLLEVLSAIDATPVAYRSELGADILQCLGDRLSTRRDQQNWWIRQSRWEDRPPLMFSVGNRFDPRVFEEFREYVRLRHQQYLELVPERGEELSSGILLTPRFDGVRPWDTTLVATRGPQYIDPEDRSVLEDRWGTPGTSTRLSPISAPAIDPGEQAI